MTTTNKMTGLMHRVLNAVAAKPLSRKLIQEKEFGGNSVNLAVAIRPLIAMKLVKTTEVDVDGKKEELITITAAGKKAAKAAPPATARASADHLSLPKVGGTIVKTYLGKEYTVKVTADGFAYKGKTYGSLTAAAKVVRGSDQEVNGWAFFGLVKPAKDAGKSSTGSK